VKRAGFECAVERCAPKLVVTSLGLPECCRLSVVLSGRVRVAFAQHFTVLDDHTSHPRIVTSPTVRLLREFQRTAHVA
jgi:hypothetical protein